LVNVNEKLKPRQEELNREIGKKETEEEMLEKDFIGLQTQLDEINSFETKKFLDEALINLDAKRKETEVRITTVENKKLDTKQLESKLGKLDSAIVLLENQIKNYDDQLIQKITGDDASRKVLNAIFTPEFATLPSSLVKKS
jgi:hypothetical protein